MTAPAHSTARRVMAGQRVVQTGRQQLRTTDTINETPGATARHIEKRDDHS